MVLKDQITNVTMAQKIPPDDIPSTSIEPVDFKSPKTEDTQKEEEMSPLELPTLNVNEAKLELLLDMQKEKDKLCTTIWSIEPRLYTAPT